MLEYAPEERNSPKELFFALKQYFLLTTQVSVNNETMEIDQN